MIGAIAGDIIGSVYEWHPTKTESFPLFSDGSRFTDDTVLTVAVADALLHGRDYAVTFKAYARRYPHAGYGGNFMEWVISDSSDPYNSWGNGSAMRVSPVGWAFDSLEEVLGEAKRSAEVTHNHPEGIKGAQAVAAAIFLARTGSSKEAIRHYLEETFGYDLQRTVAEIRPSYRFDVSCQGSVPEAIICFLEGDSYEEAVRKAISLGGDSDTQACIAGGIAEAFHGLPEDIRAEAMNRLDVVLKEVVLEFARRFLS